MKNANFDTNSFCSKKNFQAYLNKQFGISAKVDIQKYNFDDNYYEELSQDINDVEFFPEMRSEDIEFPAELLNDELKNIKSSGDIAINEDEDVLVAEAHNNLHKKLSYWLTYFKPQNEDVTVAIECGLVPFYLNDDFYLALGGCGMDFSPRLDAYQALTDGTLPKDSLILSSTSESYFAYVVGKKVTKKVLQACKLEKKLVHISFSI